MKFQQCDNSNKHLNVSTKLYCRLWYKSVNAIKLWYKSAHAEDMILSEFDSLHSAC